MLLGVLLILAVMSLMVFIKNLSITIKWKSKNKPSSADKCYFCKKEVHKETGNIKNLVCIHPNGMDIEKRNNPLSCVSECNYAFIKNEKINYEKALKLSSISDSLVSEGFRLTASLVPTTVAVMKIMG